MCYKGSHPRSVPSSLKTTAYHAIITEWTQQGCTSLLIFNFPLRNNSSHGHTELPRITLVTTVSTVRVAVPLLSGITEFLFTCSTGPESGGSLSHAHYTHCLTTREVHLTLSKKPSKRSRKMDICEFVTSMHPQVAVGDSD